MYTIKDINELKGYELRELGDDIKRQYKSGVISYDTATEAMNVILNEVNKRGAVIAKKYKKKYYNLTAISELR